MSTEFMLARGDSAAVGKSERKTKKNLLSLKTGTISTIPPVQIIMKIINAAMKGSWKSENGRTSFMLIARQRDVTVIRMIRAKSTCLS